MKNKRMREEHEEYLDLLHQHAQSLKWFKETGNKFHLAVANKIVEAIDSHSFGYVHKVLKNGGLI